MFPEVAAEMALLLVLARFPSLPRLTRESDRNLLFRGSLPWVLALVVWRETPRLITIRTFETVGEIQAKPETHSKESKPGSKFIIGLELPVD